MNRQTQRYSLMILICVVVFVGLWLARRDAVRPVSVAAEVVPVKSELAAPPSPAPSAAIEVPAAPPPPAAAQVMQRSLLAVESVMAPKKLTPVPPLRDTYEGLRERSIAGELNASCRLAVELQRCSDTNFNQMRASIDRWSTRLESAPPGSSASSNAAGNKRGVQNGLDREFAHCAGWQKGRPQLSSATLAAR